MVTLAFVGLSIAATAQIHAKYAGSSHAEGTVVGSVNFAHDLIARINYVVHQADTLYTLTYLDQNYKQVTRYETITFSNREVPLHVLYNHMKAAFLPENAPQRQTTTFVKQLQLGTDEVMLSNFKSLRNMQVLLATGDGRVISFTDRQVDELFGR